MNFGLTSPSLPSLFRLSQSWRRTRSWNTSASSSSLLARLRCVFLVIVQTCLFGERVPYHVCLVSPFPFVLSPPTRSQVFYDRGNHYEFTALATDFAPAGTLTGDNAYGRWGECWRPVWRQVWRGVWRREFTPPPLFPSPLTLAGLSFGLRTARSRTSRTTASTFACGTHLILGCGRGAVGGNPTLTLTPLTSPPSPHQNASIQLRAEVDDCAQLRREHHQGV